LENLPYDAFHGKTSQSAKNQLDPEKKNWPKKLYTPFLHQSLLLPYLIDLSHIPLQCVQSVTTEAGSGGHIHTSLVFLTALTST